MSDSLWPHELQHARLPCPSSTLGAYSYSCPSSQWCHPTISSSVVPFSCLQSFPFCIPSKQHMWVLVGSLSQALVLSGYYYYCWYFSHSFLFLCESQNFLHWQADSLPLVPRGKPWVSKFYSPSFCSAACSLPLPYMGPTEEQVWSQCRETEGLDLRIPLDTRKFRTARFVFFLAIWRRQWHPIPVLLPGKSHGWRSLVGRSPWGR